MTTKTLPPSRSRVTFTPLERTYMAIGGVSPSRFSLKLLEWKLRNSTPAGRTAARVRGVLRRVDSKAPEKSTK